MLRALGGRWVVEGRWPDGTAWGFRPIVHLPTGSASGLTERARWPRSLLHPHPQTRFLMTAEHLDDAYADALAFGVLPPCPF
jgi:hypothetical protein